MSAGLQDLPPNLPAPVDDGAADHLEGMALPDLHLASSLGGIENLAELASERLVAYIYPRTGTPGEPSTSGWDDIPGARGCTPQGCAYRDVAQDFATHGATLAGISAQSATEQHEFAQREHIPFPLFSDSALALAEALRLPTFEAGGMTLYRRLTFIAEAGRIVKTFYPVFPPDRDATQVLTWLATRGA
jgi:peroxiredoxin